MKKFPVERFGPWAVVTGASSGIGEQFARQLAAKGLGLVMVARRVGLLEKLGEDLAEEFGIEFKVIEANLADPNAVKVIVQATSNLDVGLLINNAGTGKPGRFLSLELEEILRMNQLNALAALSLTHHFGRKFHERGRGGIILSAVMGDCAGLPFMASMAASKALVSSLGKGLYHEFKNSGVHLTVMSITPTETAIIDKLGFRNSKMPMRPLTVEQCVCEGLQALSANKMFVMPGFRFRLMNSLVPAFIKRSVAGSILRKNNRIV